MRQFYSGYTLAAWLVSIPAASSTSLRHHQTADTIDGISPVHLLDESQSFGISRDDHRRLDFLFSSSCDYTSVPPYYVSPNGKNWDSANGWGLSTSKPFQTIQHAVDQRQPCQTIYVMPGTYRNSYYGESQNHQNKVIDLNNVNDLKILAYSDTSRPILQFDGPSAIQGGSANNPVSNIEISGFEIYGSNQDIRWEDAMSNRIIKRTYYNGRGIAFWAGHHIYIHHNVVHHCPASGIRVNRGDYIEISNNEVYSNTWWSSSAESAVVLAASEHIDTSEAIKMRLNDNLVYDNINKVPYYNPNYDWDYSPIAGNIDCSSNSSCQQGNIIGCQWQCRYGKTNQDYIIDGMGVYVTRNNQSYLHGRMELMGNVCYGNGINGLVVHRTDRADVRKNIVYDNGKVPRLDKNEPIVEDWHAGCSGKSRQPYSGLVLNNAMDIKLWSNNVSARYNDDYAFVIERDGDNTDTTGIVTAGGNNKACGGIVDPNLDSFVNQVYDCINTSTEAPVEPTALPTALPTLSPTSLPTESPTFPPTEAPVTATVAPVEPPPSCVDDPWWRFRGRNARSCAWLDGKANWNEQKKRKWCNKRASSDRSDKTKVYVFCKATCDKVGHEQACVLRI